MRFIGLDPGLDGGIAILAPGENPEVLIMPTVKTGKGNGRELDMIRLVCDVNMVGGCTVAIEEQQARPTDGKKSCFTSGLNYGKLLGWLETDAVPLIVVRPRAWQKVFGIGGRGTDTKAQAALVCRRLFPCVDLLATARCRKPHSGKADALLIAEWMRRRWHGKGAEDA